ncbi:MFS transporter [Rhizobium mongolense]|uniref:MFS family arabinose efflux permease n=2 Tax=Rhizobium mongolense TaxID=57676 RepID=A0ABR6ILX9_9HYPH|nr:MFS transporter [Rhizobium mongolense]MBB4228900.1 putative MFS family arabinose efflux permease [Rhizobium mongolense]TVZ63532.1 putative MFS family arabinose efflux permease [Rhizobium mongolense USDA 1844]
MTGIEHVLNPPRMNFGAAADGRRFAVIALIAFLTLVDLFAAQAILPALVEKFQVSRAAMGFAVNASTFGMAVAGLGIAFFGRSIDRRNGIWISLALLSIPTTALAFTDDLTIFAVFRVVQGLCMSAAFTLTMAYLSEHFSPAHATGALAAYVTGNVASNLFGRILSAAVAGLGGLEINFLTFAALNIGGALLVWLTLKKKSATMQTSEDGSFNMPRWTYHFTDSELRRTFAIGFLILFVFIGTFTYGNFQLLALGLSPMTLGLVYLVFLPSILTTPMAGKLATRIGAKFAIISTLGLAIVGLAALLSVSLPLVLAGLALVAVGTFLAQAIATGLIGRRAVTDKAGASGIYLACYYTGGLAGSFVLGQIYDQVGWPACIGVLIAALLGAVVIALPIGSTPGPSRL